MNSLNQIDIKISKKDVQNMGSLPSLREKKRYILLSVKSEKKLKRKDLVRSIWNCGISMVGDVGIAETGLWVMDFNGDYLLVRCNHTSVEEIKGILASLTNVSGDKIRLDILGVSGTINKLKKRFIQQEEK